MKKIILAIQLTMMKYIFIFLLLLTGSKLFSQEHAWVYFNNKPDEAEVMANPLHMLTQRALDRRTRQNISLDYKDVPISNDYINQVIAQNGIIVRAKSKWLNAVHVYGSENDINALLSLSFVSTVEFADVSLNSTMNRPSNIQINKTVNTTVETLDNYNYGGSFNQNNQIRVNYLHEQNYTGSTMQIAVIDAGFPGVDTFTAFQRIRDNNQILGGYNFVDRIPNFYQNNSHGTSVLSTIAGFVDGELIGTAPDAKFYLFITEDAAPETPLEESLWVEAAEKADSLGVDIINTSLGYQDFDDSRYDHTYNQMNGNTTFISRGATIAGERGIIVVVAAGNDGTNSYFNISAPADSPNVFTIGAVDENGTIANFSSFGPSFDNRIKPDVDAKGFQSTILNVNGEVTTGSGTSYAAPIMAGAIACFWEAFPNKTNFEIMQMIRESAHLYNNPTDQEGYGIPNLESAFQVAKLNEEDCIRYLFYPNPTKEKLYFRADELINKIQISLIDVLGKRVLNKSVISGDFIDLSLLKSGIYFIRVNDANHIETLKIVKE